MNLKVCVVLFCATFLVLNVRESSGQENHDENVVAEIVETSLDGTVHGDDKNEVIVENEDENDKHDDDGHRDNVTVEPDVEEIDHEHIEASGGTEDAEADAVPTNSQPKVQGRSGNYQYDEFMGGLDYMGPGSFDFNTGYDFDPNSRVAPSEPPTFQNGPGGYTITPQRLFDIRRHFLYPFFDRGGSNNNGDYQTDIHASMPQLHKNFNFQLPFFGFRFNYTRVSMHGFLEFSDPPEHYTYPLTFPIKDWPRRNDPSFIGIFFSKCRIGRIYQTDIDQRIPGVYFRMERDLQTRTDRFGVEMRERVMWDIREGVVGAETFIPKHAIIITWKNMTFAGGIDISLFRTNSFQMVLATDEVFTYAIFNYVNIAWSSHTEAGGDTTGGEGGVPAYIGFNAGNGTQAYEYKPYSQASVLRDLTGRGWANGFPGRHIFRLDEKIMLGTCNKDIDGAHLPLVFAPESGNMLGGTIVNISGPCFHPRERVVCKFDTESVEGFVIDQNRAICVQPFLFAQGYIRFEVAIGTEPFKWKGRYFVETPATATDRIFFRGNSIFERNPTEIQIEWNQQNLTTNLNAPITISLWGYRESTIRPQFEYIDVLDSGTTNTGRHVLAPANYRTRENPQHADMQFGFIQINLTNPEDFAGIKISRTLWSKPIPLGWYFNAQWERAHGRNWPRALCENWLRTDRFLRNFASEIPVCPCTLEHALFDKGRYMPDFDCDRDANPTCAHHKGAIHCVKTGQPNIRGSEQQCCYDRNGFLMMSYDQMWGSRPRRNHNIGVMPWNEANKVPTLSTWFNDIRPYYSCCMWQDEQAVGCETFRFERRPTQDCVSYQSPAVAGVFGDPHIVTFDDLHYTFNGMGEFVLVRTNDSGIPLDVQGRFEQVRRNIHGDVAATHLTAIVARGNTTTTPIEVRLRPTHAQWRYRLDVFAGGRRIYFDRPALKFQSFHGVTVYTPTYILNQSEVVIMFSSGAGVEVVENNGFMTARVFLPWTFINKTRGLLGTWSWDMMDDFTLPDGRVSSVNLNNFESAHRDFGIHWMLADRDRPGIGAAMFTREFGRTASHFANATFMPNFIREPQNFLPPNRTQDIQRAAELCGESYQCRFDYGMSLDRDMAHFTKTYYDTVVNMKATNERRILSCGVLETPRFGRKSTFLFTPGTQVAYECNEGFMLMGDVRRTCTSEGRWDPPIHGYTECLREVFYTRRFGWIATLIAVACTFPILICIVCVIYRFRRKNKQMDPNWKLTNSLPRSRSGSRTTLRHLNSDGSEVDSDTLKKKKKWDLDEEDITSSDGSEFPHGKLAKDIDYINANEPQRQTGRRNQRPTVTTQQPIQEEAAYLPPPVESPSSYSPTFSGLDRNSFPEPPSPHQQQQQQQQQSLGNRAPSGAVRVLPTGRYFSDGPASPESAGSPILTQNVGLPSPSGPLSPKSTKSTEV